MRTLYLKYGIRLFFFLAILVYFIAIYHDLTKKQIVIFGVIYVLVTGRLGGGFWKERKKLQNKEEEY